MGTARRDQRRSRRSGARALKNAISVVNRPGVSRRSLRTMATLTGAARHSARTSTAAPLLNEAAAIHSDLGAISDAARVDDTLRALGVRRVRPRPARPSFGWRSLTPTELGVSRLVAEGLTNPEIGARLFISRRTVETHLSNVYRKLEIANRTKLVGALAAYDGHAN